MLRGRGYIGTFLDQSHHSLHGGSFTAAVDFGLVLGHRSLRGTRDRLMQRGQPLLGIVITIHQRITRDDLRIFSARLFRQFSDVLALASLAGAATRQAVLVACRSTSDARDLRFEVLSQQKKRLIRPAVQRVFIHQRLQARNRCRIRFAQIVEPSNAEFPVSQHFLHLQQLLLGFRHQLAVGIGQDQLAVFIFRAFGVGEVAIRFFHLLVMNVGDLQLRLSGFRHIGEEDFKVAVLLLRLGQGRSPPFGVPRVADG